MDKNAQKIDPKEFIISLTNFHLPTIPIEKMTMQIAMKVII
jgi:hypothetical protein